jgi:DNA repair protein RecO (recombination protein O)
MNPAAKPITTALNGCTYVLQTYPYRESDLIVSFFTRDQGKLRGIARRAGRPKSSFGSGLERLSHANVSYYQRENRELVSLNSCELVHSQFTLASNYEASVALDYLAEVTEQLLPPNHFRLLIAVLAYLRAGGNPWAAGALGLGSPGLVLLHGTVLA